MQLPRNHRQGAAMRSLPALETQLTGERSSAEDAGKLERRASRGAAWASGLLQIRGIKLPMCTHPRCRLGPCAAVARPAAVCVRVDPPRAKVGARWLNPAAAKLYEMGLKKGPKIFACGANLPHRKLRLHDCWTPPTRVLALRQVLSVSPAQRMQRVSMAMAGVVLSVSARVRGHGWRRAAAFSLHRCSSTSSAVREHAVFVLCVSWCATCV